MPPIRSIPNCLVLGILVANSLAAGQRGVPSFEHEIAPLLARRCVSCHNDQQRKGGLSLASARSALVGGESGPVIVAGQPDQSLLVEFITGPDPEMPRDADPLSMADVTVVRRWIAAGATWPDDIVLEEFSRLDNNWWSLQPPDRPATPDLHNEADSSWARTPVDLFVLSKLTELGLAPSPEADRRTLIRRLYFDLIGLPPTPQEIQRFVGERDPLAYEKLVDRLLASPHFGERWARHWLDVVHYGDTHGYDKDKPRPHSWPYRDYVIRSFNQDKAYQQFVREQIAGDVLWPNRADAIEATGFIAAGPWDFIGHAEVPETKIDGQVARNLDRDDMVTSTINTFMSMTVQCARCHDHKFDPIRQQHYYGLQAVFAALDRADRAYDVNPEIAARRRQLIEQQESLQKRQRVLDQRIKELGGRELARIDKRLEDLAALGKSDEQASDARTRNQLEALRDQRSVLLNRVLGRETRQQVATVTASLKIVSDQLAGLPPQSKVYAGTVYHGSGAFRGTGHAGGKPREIHVLVRGDVTMPGARAEPGALPIIPGVEARFDLAPDHKEGDRRVALADWLVHTDNPLTWRCIVNRVWLYHFGRGLVDTPNDFGRMGQPPTHPQLLDWLAVRFRDEGQSLKDLHRLIVTSSVYRQVSLHNENAVRIDADNKYLWRMNRRAIDAESLRDAVLAVSGKLDKHLYGPGFQDFLIEKPEHSPHYEYHQHDPHDPKCHRRAIYRFLARSQQQPFMQTLDCADPSQSIAKRDTTLTALQALTLLNNRFMVYTSQQFAARVASLHEDRASQVRAAFRLAIGRAPHDEEEADLVAYAQRFGMSNVCRVILNLNEFLFID